MRELAGIVALLAGFLPTAAQAGFRTPESVVRNVYAHYGQGTPELSKGLPRDAATARQFFDPSLRKMWSALRVEPYDFLVQSPSWKIGPVATRILRTEFDKTTVTASFDNNGKAVTLNFIAVKGSDGWVISDIESPRDSLRLFLAQFKR
jgi:hypothetical protein